MLAEVAPAPTVAPIAAPAKRADTTLTRASFNTLGSAAQSASAAELPPSVLETPIVLGTMKPAMRRSESIASATRRASSCASTTRLCVR